MTGPEPRATNPFVGPQPFEKNDRGRFFGRTKEINELLSLVIAHRVLVLYAQSGTGKTSLINAGLIPLSEQEGFEQFPITRVRGLVPAAIDPAKIVNPFALNALISWAEPGTDPEALVATSLADFLELRNHPVDKDGLVSPRLIIFDQFEELFEFYTEHWPQRESFVRQIVEALEVDPLLRIVLVLREEYIGRLDSYAVLFPDRLRNRYRLHRLLRDQAMSAVERPLRDSGREFAPGVASWIVDELLKARVERPTGEVSEINGQYVEPVQLQVVCRTLWDNLPEDVSQITFDHVQKFGDVDEALRSFYEGSIAATVAVTAVKEAAIREWFDRQLITPAGTRGTVFEDQSVTGGLPNNAAQLMERQHLVRVEIRAGARWYELTHDRLIDPIRSSNKAWHSILAAENEKQRIEEERKRALEEAQEAEAKRKEEEERRRIEREARSARFLKWLSVGLVVCAIGAMVAGGLAIHYSRKAAMDAILRGKADSQLATMRERVALQSAAAATAHAFAEQKARARAEKAESDAEAKQKEAEGARREADTARDLAESARVISDSLALAAESTGSLVEDPERSLLLALQAHMAMRVAGPTTIPQVEDALHRAVESSHLRVRVDHLWENQAVAMSPDGRRIAAASWSGTAEVWDSSTAKKVLSLYHGGGVFGLAFSPTGKEIVTCGSDKTVKIWDAQTGNLLHTLRGHTDYVFAVTFSPDGRRIGTISEDGTARVWDSNSGNSLRKIELGKHGSMGFSIAFSPDEKTIVTSDGGNAAKIWNSTSGHLLRSFSAEGGAILSAAYSPSGTRIVTGNADTTATIWDVVTGQKLLTLKGHTADVEAVRYSRDATRIITASADNTARIWDATSGEALETLRGHSDRVSAAIFTPDHQSAITASWDGTVRIWNTREALTTGILNGEPMPVRSIEYSPLGDYLIVGRDDGAIEVCDPATGNRLRPLLSPGQPITSVSVSSDATLIAAGDAIGTIHVWNVHSGEELWSTSAHDDWISGIAFNPDSTEVATASWDKTAKIWDAKSGHLIHKLTGHSKEVTGIAYSPEGARLVTASWDGTLIVWAVASGKKLIAISGKSDAFLDVAFSPDGTQIAAGGLNGTVGIWDPVSGKNLANLSGHSARLRRIRFSPDGNRIAAASADGTAIIWNSQPGAELYSLRGHSGVVYAVAYSPEGRSIATAGQDGTVRIWDAALAGGESWATDFYYLSRRGFAISPDARSVAIAYFDGTIEIYDASTKARLMKLQIPKEERADFRPEAIAFSADGRKLGVGSADGIARIWEVNSSEKLPVELRGHDGAVTAIAFSPDGASVTTGGRDKTVQVWDLKTGQEVVKWGPEGSYRDDVDAIAYSPDGKTIATGDRDTDVVIIDTTTAKTHNVNGLYDVSTLAFSPTGNCLAVADRSGRIKLIDTRSWRETAHAEHAGGVLDLSFSPDGRRIATGGADDTARIWDASSGQPLFALAGHTREVVRVAFSRDGTHLVTGSTDGTVSEYVMKADELARIARTRATRSLSAAERERFLPGGRDFSPGIELAFRGRQLARIGDFDGAVALLRRANSINPHLQINAKSEIAAIQAKSLVSHGRFLASNGDLEEALADLTAARELDSSLSPEPHAEVNREYSKSLQLQGKIAAMGGRVPEAARYYRLAQMVSSPAESFDSQRTADREYASALVSQGKALADTMFDYAAAYERLSRAHELVPNDTDTTEDLAEACIETERYAEGRTLAEQLLAKSAQAHSGVYLYMYERFAMRFEVVAAQVLQNGINADTREILSEFVEYAQREAKSYRIGHWSYRGFKEFIENRSMKENERNLILHLIDRLDTDEPRFTMSELEEYFE